MAKVNPACTLDHVANSMVWPVGDVAVSVGLRWNFMNVD